MDHESVHRRFGSAFQGNIDVTRKPHHNCHQSCTHIIIYDFSGFAWSIIYELAQTDCAAIERHAARQYIVIAYWPQYFPSQRIGKHCESVRGSCLPDRMQTALLDKQASRRCAITGSAQRAVFQPGHKKSTTFASAEASSQHSSQSMVGPACFLPLQRGVYLKGASRAVAACNWKSSHIKLGSKHS